MTHEHPAAGPSNRKGFSLIEVIVSILILTVGLLGLAAATGWVLRNSEAARIDTARTTALQSAIEQVRATPFDDIAAGGTANLPGGFTAAWTGIGSTPQSVLTEIVVTGPGRVPGAAGTYPQFANTVVDTITYRVLR
jgi:prepilin-type N-terminal cleavage/methylation domain-containing protein